MLSALALLHFRLDALNIHYYDRLFDIHAFYLAISDFFSIMVVRLYAPGPFRRWLLIFYIEFQIVHLTALTGAVFC